MMLGPARPDIGPMVCQSSSVINGMMGWAKRNTVSSTRNKVRRVARCCAAIKAPSLPPLPPLSRLRARGAKLHLCQLQIPIAVLVPDKLIDGFGGQVETVFGKGFFNFSFSALQLAD